MRWMAPEGPADAEKVDDDGADADDAEEENDVDATGAMEMPVLAKTGALQDVQEPWWNTSRWSDPVRAVSTRRRAVASRRGT